MTITKELKKKIIIGIGIAVIAIVGGLAAWSFYSSDSEAQTTNANSTSSATNAAADDSDDIDWASLPTKEVALSNAGLDITAAGTYILSGTTTGNVTVSTDGYVRIILNGVTIKSSEGPAIYIESAEKTIINLADGTQNTVTDASTRSDEEIDGAIYSADDLVINGNGNLVVNSTYADGIVGKDDLWINSGNITVKSVDDGIRGKDSLTINGGTIVLDVEGDGMKVSNDVDAGEGQLIITGGDITINSGDDAIKAEQKVSISGGKINIETSVEGIEAPVIVIDNGDINLYASDDGINAAASAIITTGISITINGGTVTVEVGPGDTDAIDSNGDIYVNGGTINITTQMSSFDFNGSGAINGGTVTVNGSVVTEMPASMMGGGGRR